MRRKAVILLKSPSTEDLSQDPYFKCLSEHGYSPYFVPVLEDAFSNEDALDNTLAAGPSAFTGVIVTSGRAVKAWEQSARRITSRESSGPTGWDKIPFYAVGPKTADQMRSMANTYHLDPGLCPALVLGEQASGTGERLARFVVSDQNSRNAGASSSPSLLYLTGDKAGEMIPNILHEAEMPVTSLQVYETRSSSTFDSDFYALLDTLQTKLESVAWIAFFSPSGGRTALPAIRRKFHLFATSDASPPADVRLAAIGPTTASFLHDESHLIVHATAPRPDPQAFADAIETYDNKES